MGKRASKSKAKRHEDGRLVRVFSQPEVIVNGTRIALYFAEVDGRAVCARVEIGADFTDPTEPDPAPITSQLVRELGLSTRIAESIAGYADMCRTLTGWSSKPSIRATVPGVEAALEGRRRPGRPRLYDEAHYRSVATFYNAEAKAGNPAATKAVAEQWNVSASTAAKWVGHARHELQLIQPAKR